MSSVILAIKNGEIIGALDPAQYKSADEPHPFGWKELLDADINFDQVDLDCVSDEQSQAILKRYQPHKLFLTDRQKFHLKELSRADVNWGWLGMNEAMGKIYASVATELLQKFY